MKTLQEHNYFSIDATIIADSINQQGNRLTTFVCTFPRIILSETNTHKMISKNSASSRAVPFDKMLKRVEEHPFIPTKFMKDHKGMQGTEFFDKNTSAECLKVWLEARDNAINKAKELNSIGLSKQIVNRLLEPWMWHTAILTATDYENFFALRAHEAAEIHLQDLAYKMLEAYNDSKPKQLKEGQWHLPFNENIDNDRVLNLTKNLSYPKNIDDEFNIRIKICTARCARISYFNFEGKDDYEADIKLHDMLLSSGHFSPFEHCARTLTTAEFYNTNNGIVVDGLDNVFSTRSGNLNGFIQYRKTLQNENRKDERVKKLQLS